MPNVFQYSSYVFFFPSAIAGPTFDFMEYKRLITRTGHYQLKFNPFFRSLRSFLGGLLFVVGTIVVTPLYKLSFCLTDEFKSYNVLRQILGLNLACMCARIKFYAGWYLAQSGVDACGLSFNGFDHNGKQKFNRVKTVKIDLELADNPKYVFDVL